MWCAVSVHAKRTARAFVDSTCWSRGCSSCRRPDVADRRPCSTGARRCANGYALQPPAGCQGIRFHIAEGTGSPELQETAVGPGSAIAVARPLRPCERGGGNNSPPLNDQDTDGSNRAQSGGSAVSGASSERLPAVLRQRNVMPGHLALGDPGGHAPRAGDALNALAAEQRASALGWQGIRLPRAASNGLAATSFRARLGAIPTPHTSKQNPYTTVHPQRARARRVRRTRGRGD